MSPPEDALRDAELAIQNERLTAITSIARTLFSALEPTLLVEVLLGGVRELLGGKATLYAPRPGGGYAVTGDLSRCDEQRCGDGFITLAGNSDVIVIDEHERRAAVKVAGSGRTTAFVLDVASETPYSSADIFAIGLLAQYFGVAVRNVELYQELAARRDAVVELNQVKNDLIAMMAHDFKGPLTAIVGFADVLAEDERFDADSREYLGIISSSAMRLAALATETLVLSRLEHNELSLALEEIDLAALVNDVVRVLGVTRAIDLRVSTGMPKMRGDAARLRQVIENLIGNAIKYSPGGEPVDVAVRAPEAGRVEIAVRDRGIGIPESERTKLFSRFARASNARALGIGGTGFGLYLARTIVDLHGGRISVDSSEGRGSTFRVVLPVQPPQRASATLRLVLLDSDGEARSYVAHALREDGYAVSVAANANDLVRLVGEAHFDAALVDVDRLGSQAEAIVRQLRERHVPVVRIGLHRSGETNGAEPSLAKPFLMKDLYAALDTAVSQASGSPG